jgi:hypothetical protein
LTVTLASEGVLMNLLRRLLSAGGWLANIANQTSRYSNFGHDDAVRPVMIFPAMGFLLFFAAWFAVLSLGQPGSEPGSAVGSAALCVLAVLMGLGWRVGLVPFAPLPNVLPVPAGESSWADSQLDVEVRTTGVVGYEQKRRFRNRPANLTRTTLTVYPWIGGLESKLPVASSDLGPRTISMIECGTAFLVTGTRPAIRLVWKHGPVILAFDDFDARDQVFARMVGRRWQARPLF